MPLFLVVAPLALLAAISLSTWTVVPPSAPQNQRTVFISDYGRHSRLALQIDDMRMIEYAFGDWAYYALGERSVWRGILALTTPTEAGLGRRILPFIEESGAFSQMSGAVRSARLDVELEHIEALLDELDRRYRENLETETSPDHVDLTFVKDSRPYHLFHNSNYQVADWLHRLGCEVEGSPILSNFTLESSP